MIDARSVSSSHNLPAQGLLKAVVLAALFPWVSFSLNSLDTQPWFLLLALAYIAVASGGRVNKKNILAWIFLIIMVIYLLLSSDGDFAHTVRGVATYATAALSVIIFRYFVDVDLKIRIRVLVFVNLCWLFYPVVQASGLADIYPLVIARTSETRGYTSLAPEPTFYGLFSIVMMAILWLEKRQCSVAGFKSLDALRGLFWLNLVQIFLVAQSSMVILLLAVIGAVALLIFRPKSSIFVFLVFGLAIWMVLPIIAEDAIGMQSRPLQLLGTLANDTSLIVMVDQSINERVVAVYISVYEAIKSGLIPHGLTAFERVSAEYARTVDMVTTVHGNKIMSFIGSFLFELGFIALIYLFVLLKAIFSQASLRERVFWFMAFGVVLLTAVPVGFPLVGYVVALLERQRIRTSITRNQRAFIAFGGAQSARSIQQQEKTEALQ